MDDHGRAPTDDPFLLNYDATELRIASEFLGNWLPFLSRGLCGRCSRTLSDSVRSLRPVGDVDGDVEPLNRKPNDIAASTSNSVDLGEIHEHQEGNCEGSCKDGDRNDPDDAGDTNSLGSWKDGDSGRSEPIAESSASEPVGSQTPMETPRLKMSWADMAQEDEFEAQEESEVSNQLGTGSATSGEASIGDKVMPKMELSRDEREHIRFRNVKREKDLICFERYKGKFVNILQGLELHTGVFSAVEQKRIVNFVYDLQEMGRKGQLKERTYTAPQKWMRGKGRVTIQFGCCYNYATDKNGNPPGILKNELVDPIPHLFKVIIKRLVRWHVLPPSCVPDSCIVNIYDEGDCIPPHIDNHDFVRPFCTVSFLSECNIVFGTELKILDAGEFSGAIAIPLPVGSVLVLNGNGADVAKHCVPAVPTKRISITFRKMDEKKWPIGFVPEPDLQGLQPLSYEEDKRKGPSPSKPKRPENRQGMRREENREEAMGSSTYRRNSHLDPRSIRVEKGPGNRRNVRLNSNG